jgi:hypothetical protein
VKGRQGLRGPPYRDEDKAQMSAARHTRTLLLCLGATLAFSCGGETPVPAAPPSGRAAKARRPAHEKLDPRAVVTAFRGNESSLHACFELRGEPVRGVLRMSWQVDSAGIASSPRVEEAKVGDPTIGECLSEQIANLRFGARESTAEARWTFVSRLFEPPSPEEEAKKRERARKRSRGKKRPPPPAEKGVTIDPTSPGFIEPSSVDDIVSANFGLFAHCYRGALERRPGLAGVVRLRFVIGAGGNVVSVRDAGSDLPDGKLVDCVAEGFYALSFPKAQGDEVRVLYRLVFDSGVSG